MTSIFPASYAQSRLWFIQTMSPASTAYNMLAPIPLPDCDVAVVGAALADLVRRHETLRTGFALEGDRVVQRILPEAEIALEVCEASDAGSAAHTVSAHLGQPFDLAAAPLARAVLVRVAGRSPTLALIVHHIAADGQTLRILAEDLLASIAARMEGRPPVLPEAPVEYADYAVWQRRTLQGPRRERLSAYWTERLADLPDLTLPIDRERRPESLSRGDVVRFTLDPDTAAALRRIARDARTTFFGVLLTGYAALLSRIGGQTDLPIGLPVSGRTRTEFERVAGLFVNSLVFRARVPADAPFIVAVRRVGADLVADLSHQDMPFELLVEALHPRRRADANPLFQTMFQLQVRAPDVTGRDDREPQLETDAVSPQLDLSFILFDTGEGPLNGGAIYSAELFDRGTAEGLAAAYVTLLRAAARAPDRSIGALPLLEGTPRAATLALGRGPVRDWTGPETLHEWFAEEVHRAPNRIAVTGDGESVSLGDLDHRATAIARELAAAGVSPGAVVALSLPRSVDLVAAMIGALKARAAYLPLDPALPPARREAILRDCGAAALLRSSDGPLGHSVEPGLGQDAPRFPPEPPADRPAYVIYTSGSTGEPNGVAIPHAAAVNHMRWMIDAFGFGAGDRVLQRTPPGFDASVWEFWVPLLSGGCLVLPSGGGPFDPAALLADVGRHGITTLQAVPSLLAALLDHPDAGRLSGLTRCFCGGEALGGALARRFCDLTGIDLVNLYGPSETTIDATFHVDDAAEAARVPIGRPIANVSARVLDAAFEPVPPGFIGELCIGGRGVGLGYFGPRRADRFVADPHEPSGRLFRTGDRASMNAAGVISYHGRLDEQIKLRGFRIEPGEVESELMRHPALSEAAAVVRSHGEGDDRLIAFAHLRPDADAVTGPDLVRWLRGRLASHAVPSCVELSGALPRTAHGKVDRTALRRREMRVPATPVRADRPAGGVEGAICDDFGQVLGLAEVDADDEFFQIGGHSLLVVPLTAALSADLGVEVSVVDIFEHPTPRRLAEALRARGPSAPPFAVSPKQTEARP